MSTHVIRVVAFLLALALPRAAAAEWLYALTDGSNRLGVVDTSDLTRLLAEFAITGLDASEVIVAIDFRPRDGQLYGIARKPQGSVFSARLYRMHMVTGVATPIPTGRMLDGNPAEPRRQPDTRLATRRSSDSPWRNPCARSMRSPPPAISTSSATAVRSTA